MELGRRPDRKNKIYGKHGVFYYLLLVVVEQPTDDHEVRSENGHSSQHTKGEASKYLYLHVQRYAIRLNTLVLQDVAAD